MSEPLYYVKVKSGVAMYAVYPGVSPSSMKLRTAKLYGDVLVAESGSPTYDISKYTLEKAYTPVAGADDAFLTKTIAASATATEDAPFARGDVVLLKSGGMKMVVHNAGDVQAKCIWHTEEGELRDEWIPTLALQRWEP